MADLKTTFAGLTLKNPVIISSSGLTNRNGAYLLAFFNQFQIFCQFMITDIFSQIITSFRIV